MPEQYDGSRSDATTCAIVNDFTTLETMRTDPGNARAWEFLGCVPPDKTESRHVALFRPILDSLTRWDPARMAAYGMDEYDIEAAHLALLVEEWQSPDNLAGLVHEILVCWFSWRSFPEYENYYCTNIANDLWNALRTQQGSPPEELDYLPKPSRTVREMEEEWNREEEARHQVENEARIARGEPTLEEEAALEHERFLASMTPEERQEWEASFIE